MAEDKRFKRPKSNQQNWYAQSSEIKMNPYLINLICGSTVCNKWNLPVLQLFRHDRDLITVSGLFPEDRIKGAVTEAALSGCVYLKKDHDSIKGF